MPKPDARPLNKHDFEILADFRHQIRKFVRFSEQVARQHRIKPLQYLLLLHIKGYPGRDWATVGELAERLQAQHHGVVALISRCEKQGFVERRRRRAKECSMNWRACTVPSCCRCRAVSSCPLFGISTTNNYQLKQSRDRGMSTRRSEAATQQSQCLLREGKS